MKWLDDFKRALIEEDFDMIERLINQTPQFEEISQQELALSLIQEAKNIVKKQKDKTFQEMQKIQKIKKFEKQSCNNSLDISY